MAKRSPACDLSSHTSGRNLTPTCSLSGSAFSELAATVHASTAADVRNVLSLIVYECKGSGEMDE